MIDTNMSCPDCNAQMQPVSPDGKVHACSQCGVTVNENGDLIKVDKEQLKDMLSQAVKVISDSFGDKLPHTTKTILVARTVEYGMQMWQDGLRQGMLLGLKQELSK